MRERVTADRTVLHLSMRRVSEREVIRSGAEPWAVFGWTMIALAATFAVLVIVFMIAFVGEPGAGA